MDMYINSEALASAEQGIAVPLETISTYLMCLDTCVTSAKDSFQTVNSDTVDDCFSLLEKGIENMKNNVENAKKFLNQLEQCLERYDSLRF